ncbi:MAG: glycosyltransferase [Bacteroidales bacterium]|nr:glycosyltransferase [Bacteroidales bacterium]MCF8391520.1 glycosyltransferase [Bacteroidales bacterium]
MEVLKTIILIIESGLLAYLGLAALYFLIFALASHFYKEKSKVKIEKKSKVAILIPAYKEDNVILDSAISAMQQISKNAELKVWVIADSLKPDTIDKIRNSGAGIIEVSFDKSTKAKSINYALNNLPANFDYSLILDADNIMQSGFVDRLIERLNTGYRIVQGHRTAKNSNTGFAFLDGLSEEVNNNIFRKGHRVLGLSASLIGSGFICEFQLFKDLMKKVDAVGGFDKELELLLLKDKITIGYAQDAIVFDEKIQQADAFMNQRRRWLSAQFIFFGRNIGKGLPELFLKGNFDYFDKLIQFVIPPRIITLGLSFTIAFLYHAFLLFSGFENASSLYFLWTGLFLVSSLAVLISIPSKKYNLSMLKSAISLPNGFLLTLIALLKLKGANNQFIHTQHNINKL